MVDSCAVPNELCCQANVPGLLVNVWSLTLACVHWHAPPCAIACSNPFDNLLSTSLAEVEVLVASAGWVQICNPFGVGTPDSRQWRLMCAGTDCVLHVPGAQRGLLRARAVPAAQRHQSGRAGQPRVPLLRHQPLHQACRHGAPPA